MCRTYQPDDQVTRPRFGWHNGYLHRSPPQTDVQRLTRPAQDDHAASLLARAKKVKRGIHVRLSRICCGVQTRQRHAPSLLYALEAPRRRRQPRRRRAQDPGLHHDLTIDRPTKSPSRQHPRAHREDAALSYGCASLLL